MRLFSFSLLCVLSNACSSTAAPNSTNKQEPTYTQAQEKRSATVHTTEILAAADAKPSDKASKKYNVLMISIDSMRADMPWTGYPRDIAPNLTAFEKQSVNYTRAYALSSYTSMSLGGFLAGRYPSEVDRSGYFFGNYPDSVLMFPEVLQKAGVRTMSAQAHFYFDKKAGFHQGFDIYKIVPDISADNTTDRNITSPKHVALAKEMLSDKANTQGTFFAWYHFLDPHDVYMEHKEIKPFGKSARDKYDGEMLFTDKYVGELLDFVRTQTWGANTVIIITADHGEAFGEHKHYRHGFEVWDVLTHVPLMIQMPGASARKIDTPRSAVDLAPTILELTGTPADATFRGKSLVAELMGAAPEPRPVVVDLPRTSDNDRRRALIDGSYKITAYGDDDGYDFFDLSADPDEKKDIKRSNKEAFEQMKEKYKSISATIHDVCPKHVEKLKGRKKSKKC